MALFHRAPQLSDPVNYVTVGMNKVVLLVGLGNPGDKYSSTRHNIGFEVLDYFVSKSEDMHDWISKKDLKCLVSDGRLGETRVLAIKPQTFMNNSGEAVQAVTSFYKIQPSDIAVVHDELDINFGQIRTRLGGSAAGHNGIKSIIQHIGQDFGRIRIGIGPKIPDQIDSADFVLQKFSSEQLDQMPALKKEATALITEYIYGGQLPADTRNFII